MEMKTSELTGLALGAAVAMAEGRELVPYPEDAYAADPACRKALILRWADGRNTHFACMRCQREKLDISWERCGPIMEEQKIGVLLNGDGAWEAGRGWEFFESRSYAYFRETGPEPLVAAMRCFVSSKLGDEVEIPEELK